MNGLLHLLLAVLMVPLAFVVIALVSGTTALLLIAIANLKVWLTRRWRCHGSWMPGRWAHRRDPEWLAIHGRERRWQLLRHLFDYPPARVRPKR